MAKERRVQHATRIISLLAATVCAILIFGQDRAPSEVIIDKPSFPDQRIYVQTEVAVRRVVNMQFEATGRVLPAAWQTLGFSSGGRIIRIVASEGQQVREGQALAFLDSSTAKLELAAVEARLQRSLVNFGERMLDIRRGLRSIENENNNPPASARQQASAAVSFPDLLFTSEPASWSPILASMEKRAHSLFLPHNRRTLAAIRSGLLAAITDRSLAARRLQQKTLRAPASGRIANIRIRKGEYMPAATACMDLLVAGELFVEVEVLETDIKLAMKTQHALVRLPALSAAQFKASVVSRNPSVDPDRRAQRVMIRLDAPDEQLLPGMFAIAVFKARLPGKRLLVPERAVVLRDDRPVLFIARRPKEGTEPLAYWSYVKTGVREGGFIEIIKSAVPLRAGDQVVVSNHFAITDQTPLRLLAAE